MKRDLDHFYGCLMGGAIGDAFGAPVEFMKYSKIVETYGDQGLTNLVFPVASKKAIITDDTQLTLFTAEGLIRSYTRAKQKQVERNNRDVSIVVFRAYLRWLYTQGLRTPNWGNKTYDGWLVHVKGLHFYREPGVTCITSLGRGIMGTIANPINDSTRCGGIIRITPVGLFEAEEDVFDRGCAIAAITHGGPNAYLPAGVLATIIYYIIEGDTIEQAISKALAILKTKNNSEVCVKTIERAIKLAEEKEPSYKKVKMLGEGFEGDESLAIGIYSALNYPEDYKAAVCLAANHDGDSDSTSYVAGSIVGTFLGADALDAEWIKNVELAEEIKVMAQDLLTKYEETDEWKNKYPGW